MASEGRICPQETPPGVSLFRRFERGLKPFDVSAAIQVEGLCRKCGRWRSVMMAHDSTAFAFNKKTVSVVAGTEKMRPWIA